MITLKLNEKQLLLNYEFVWTTIFSSIILGCLTFKQNVEMLDWVLSIVFIVGLISYRTYELYKLNNLKKGYTEDTTLNNAENIRKYVADDASDILYIIKPTIDCDETDVDYMVISEDDQEVYYYDSEDIMNIYGINLDIEY